jgi:hypothetical protein
MRILKVTSALVIALLTAAMSEQANAVIVEYTLTFTGKSGDRANGTGTLVVNEPTPLNSFSEKSYGDLVSLTANIGGRTYNFAPSLLRSISGRIKHSMASRVRLRQVCSDRMV